MQIISRLKNKNVLVATAIGALLGLVAGAKGEGNLFFSVLFGVAVGAFVGSLGGLRFARRIVCRRQRQGQKHLVTD